MQDTQTFGCKSLPQFYTQKYTESRPQLMQGVQNLSTLKRCLKFFAQQYYSTINRHVKWNTTCFNIQHVEWCRTVYIRYVFQVFKCKRFIILSLSYAHTSQKYNTTGTATSSKRSEWHSTGSLNSLSFLIIPCKGFLRLFIQVVF